MIQKSARFTLDLDVIDNVSPGEDILLSGDGVDVVVLGMSS
jgi:hypothetical protein